ILGGEVHHREIFVIEFAVLVDQIAVAFDQIGEQRLVRVHVPIQIHADEAVELQEARIDVAHHARMRERHLGDDIVAEPIDAALRRQIIDSGRIAPCIDRAAHQRHRQRHERVVVGFHHGNGCHNRHRRLAHRDDVHVAAERVQHLDHVVDVIVEIEPPFGERHHARIGPVGDVDLMGRQERLDRAAQQRRIVAGHRRHDQHTRVRRAQRARQLAVEMQQAAERLFPDRANLDRRADAVDLGRRQVPIRLAVAARGALEQFAAGGDRFAEFGVGPRIERVLKQDLGGVGYRAHRIERRMRHLVHPVQRRRECRTAFRRQWRCTKFTDGHSILRPLFAPQHTDQCVTLRQCAANRIWGRCRAKTPGIHVKVTFIHHPRAATRCAWRSVKGQGRSQKRQRTGWR
ncbi:hypothetical protein chiPu_0027567, partial [Chiloscyllium punctatum]|nr:hypothetical protein [Chiloscyllium punctatum]